VQDHFIIMHADTFAENSSPTLKKKATKLLAKNKALDWEDKDIISMVDWNERRH